MALISLSRPPKAFTHSTTSVRGFSNQPEALPPAPFRVSQRQYLRTVLINPSRVSFSPR
nr:MAG TPA: hypothetical protein [Caudoviricetes sp.]DAT52902.1 MAG TPA: hypothetical protein [Caudoviricetes sp.]DAX55928.1 MAG TPA: hypothetical protein [Caudoviricetes sp.]DAY47982.1 MAG TPA: hypothetical protein [Caudoviricetes sp.]